MTDETVSTDRHAPPEEDDSLLTRVPEWVVALGAGSLATATLLTSVAALFMGYSFVTSQWYGYQPYQIGFATLEFTLVTVFQAAGTYYARDRTRWMWVMLAAIAGSLTLIVLPFTIVTLFCIGLGKYHFSSYMPVDQT
jgi:hypothetical protein